jgi:hypothetical protein
MSRLYHRDQKKGVFTLVRSSANRQFCSESRSGEHRYSQEKSERLFFEQEAAVHVLNGPVNEANTTIYVLTNVPFFPIIGLPHRDRKLLHPQHHYLLLFTGAGLPVR